MKHKLKLVVASMSAIGVLGLISSPALAATETTTQTTTDAQTQVHKHKHHKKAHKVSHVVAVESNDYKGDYKGEMQPVPVPVLDTYTTIYDSMSQNSGRSKPLPDWFNRIGISGGLAADAHWGNRSIGYMGENNSRLSLNDAYVNLNANVNDWTKAFLSASFSNTSTVPAGALGAFIGGGNNGTISPKAGMYSDVYNNNRVTLEQGYVTLANYDVSPFFLQIGKQYTDFGRYQIHPIERTLTQVLSESLQTSIKLGFITRIGIHGQVYAFDNSMRRVTLAHTKTIYGAALGFDQPNEQLGYDVGVGYMSNIIGGVNDIAYAVGLVNGSNAGGAFGGSGTYIHPVGGIAVYADVNSGPFTLGARYTTAIQSFSPTDLSNQYAKNVRYAGARPWAADITAGYGFTGWNRSQNVYLGYQTSNNAVNLMLPKNRWMAGYNVDVVKATNIGLELGHDTDYSSGNGGTGNSSNTIAARASVKFG